MGLAQIKSLIWKDLLLEARRLSDIGAALVFSISAASLVGFAANKYMVEVGGVLLAGVGLILIEVFLAVFTATMSFVREADKGTLDGLRSSPVEPVAVFVSKLIFTLIVLEALTMTAAATAMFFGGNALRGAVSLFPLLASAGLYLSAVSAFASALSIYIEARGILLPTIILALSMPLIQDVIVFAGGGSRGPQLLALSGLGFMLVTSWLSKYVLEV